MDIFVKGTAWVVEPFAGGRGLKMCSMFTHVINCRVCHSIRSSSMEINVRWELIRSPRTNLGFLDVAHSLFIHNYQCTVSLSECTKEKANSASEGKE